MSFLFSFPSLHFIVLPIYASTPTLQLTADCVCVQLASDWNLHASHAEGYNGPRTSFLHRIIHKMYTLLLSLSVILVSSEGIHVILSMITLWVHTTSDNASRQQLDAKLRCSGTGKLLPSVAYFPIASYPYCILTSSSYLFNLPILFLCFSYVVYTL